MAGIVTEHLDYPEDDFDTILSRLNLSIMKIEPDLGVELIIDKATNERVKPNGAFAFNRKYFEDGMSKRLYCTVNDKPRPVVVHKKHTVKVTETGYVLDVDNLTITLSTETTTRTYIDSFPVEEKPDTKTPANNITPPRLQIGSL